MEQTPRLPHPRRASCRIARHLAADQRGSMMVEAAVALPLGLGLGATTVKNTVASQLLLLAPALDTVVNSLTNALGVKLGVADVTVDRIRSGRPTMVG